MEEGEKPQTEEEKAKGEAPKTYDLNSIKDKEVIFLYFITIREAIFSCKFC